MRTLLDINSREVYITLSYKLYLNIINFETLVNKGKSSIS